MPAQITGLLGRLKDTIGQFSAAQRTLAILAIAVLALGLAALTTWVSKPTLSPLFSGVSTTDASAIVDVLASNGVSYELTDGGTTILVPAGDLYSMRLAAAAAGLPASADGGGYSLLDDMGMTSSEFQQQVTYQRALEGELGKTISAMNGVEAATVRLALPEDTVFVETKADPTASVFVRTKVGTTLSSDKVQSIVHLVSAGIQGMKTTDVAVIDADGRVLSAIGGAGAATLQEGRTSDYEARVAANVQQMLDPLVGVGRAVVSVTADLDYDTTERTSESFSRTEDDLPPLTSSTTLEQYVGNGKNVGGVLGPDEIEIPEDAKDGNQYRNESATVVNPVDKVTERSVTAPGTVRRQSVSVVLDQQVAAAFDIRQLETMVSAAAGLDTERGDVVSVTRMAFDQTSAQAAAEALASAESAAQQEQLRQTITTGAIAGGVVLALLLAFITARRRAARTRREALDLGELEVLEARRLEAIESAEAALAIAPPAPVDEIDAASLTKRDELVALANESPDEVATALRGWLQAGSR